MTNFEYIKSSDEETLAEILVTFLITSIGAIDIPTEIILKEKAGILAWLKDDIIEGQYLN